MAPCFEKVQRVFLFFWSDEPFNEPFHCHVSYIGPRDRKSDTGKIFIRADGSSEVILHGNIAQSDLTLAQKYIALRYKDMAKQWKEYFKKPVSWYKN